jgi:BirA family biotin operon repressor/biotin-[acetyl-CoA-carboxylase] ligase
MTIPQNSHDKADTPADVRARALVRVLADGRFRSGEELGEAAGVSRAAIWKLVEQLRELGLQVDSVKGRGYRLARPVELLEADTIAAELAQLCQASVPVEVLFRCKSTNAILLERARAGEDAQLLTTEIQYAGRGRWGRDWFAPFGSALCLSVLWRFPVLPYGLSGLSLAVAVGVAEALAQEEVPIRLKWPNDLMVDGRKLGGILIEVAGEVEGPCSVVIGLGINLAEAQAIGEQAQQAVVSLEDVIGDRALRRNRLAARLGAAVARTCRRFEAEGFAPFAPRWADFDLFAGEPVVLLLPGEEVRGIARGVDAGGALLLERDGELETRFSGDLRLRLRRDPVA